MTAPVDVLAVMEMAAGAMRKSDATYSAAKVLEARAAIAELIEAAGHRVANSFAEAQGMDDRGEHPIWCEVDALHPCWSDGRNQSTALPLQHWGGGDACPECRLRAALRAVGPQS